MDKNNINYSTKQYKHIDNKVKFDKVKNYVFNSNKIAKHSFLPFIHYKIIFEKYSNGLNYNCRPIKIKTRDIYYSGHLDGYIYKYYSEILNEKYNKFMVSNNLDEVSLAYRDNKFHMSSINFAAELINHISKLTEAVIIIGDFTNFFDKLDHKLLKERLVRILENDKQTNTGKLNNDWFNIYRSLTKYGFLDKEELEKNCKNIFKDRYFEKLNDFWKYKKIHKVKNNPDSFGIPQGTAISGVFANVYSIDFDKMLSSIAAKYKGIYRRYSDDFVLILDTREKDGICINEVYTQLLNIAKENKIELQPDKTKLYKKCDNKIFQYDIELNKMLNVSTHIDFLGFTYDGINVRMREKSIYKFYRKSKKIIRQSRTLQKKLHLKKLPNRHLIYSLYTDFGSSSKYSSNFIKYAKRSQSIFDKYSPETKNLMLDQLKNRKKKIERYLGYNLHFKY